MFRLFSPKILGSALGIHFPYYKTVLLNLMVMLLRLSLIFHKLIRMFFCSFLSFIVKLMLLVNVRLLKTFQVVIAT